MIKPMIDDSEVLAGLAFLERYARPEFQPALRMATQALSVVRAKQQLDAVRARDAADLELSVRSLAALLNMGLKTVADVETFVGKPDAVALEFGKRHHFGKKCLREVREALKDIGLPERRNAVPHG
jgi:DNA-directed RNA polymerase alpha subunit